MEKELIDAMVSRFLGWRLPKDFAPDCGISFDGRKDDEWNKNKTWPIGTNVLNADQARDLFVHLLSNEQIRPKTAEPVAWLKKNCDGDDIAIPETNLRRKQPQYVQDLWKNAEPLYRAAPPAQPAEQERDAFVARSFDVGIAQAVQEYQAAQPVNTNDERNAL